MTQLTTLRAARWGEGAVPALPRSLRLLKLGEDIELGLGGGGQGERPCRCLMSGMRGSKAHVLHSARTTVPPGAKVKDRLARPPLPDVCNPKPPKT